MKLSYIIVGFLFLSYSEVFSQQVINGFSMPESITSDGESFFVSNQGQDVFIKDGDGFISKISADGKMIELKFIPTKGVLNAPKGMAIENSVLYVADLDRVVGYNLSTREIVFELSIPEAKVLNDICRLENGYLAVTETVSGNIYKINTKEKAFEIIGNIPGVNGVSYNKKMKQLLACSNGKNYGQGSVYIKTGNGQFQELPNISSGFFDGIEWIDDEHVLISDWVTFPTIGFGKLWIYDLKNQQSRFLFTEESTADIYFDRAANKIWMPQMFQNKVTITDQARLSSNSSNFNKLYNYGVIDAFVGGLYKGTLPVKAIKLKGDFGLGAPDMLDGELTMIDGKAYQTKANGETQVLDDDHKVSFSAVTFFKADTTFYITPTINRDKLLEIISSALSNKNAMFAVKITGDFKYVKTRAFPPVKEEPFPELALILDRQQFFNHTNTSGAFVGYHLPEYLNGINAAGFHLHFISTDKKQGGHVLDFNGQNLKIDISTLKSLELETPKDNVFQKFHFKKADNEALERVEKGQ